MGKVGIFGGTFDPIHFGHLITTRFVLENRNLDKIIFIPCFISPLKTKTITSMNLHRYNMVKLAVEDSEGFEVSDFEINREEVSYTVNTIKHFKKLYNSIELIIGYDNLLVFDKWHQHNEIFKLADVIVMKRIDRLVESTKPFVEKAIIVDTPIMEISSTLIRQRVKENKSIDYLVPEKIKNYIFNNKLYV